MSKLYTLVLFCLFNTSLFAQLEVHEAGADTDTPENLIYQYFLGDGVKVLNVTYDGPPMSVGYFDKGKQLFGIERGIVMTTGIVKTISNGASMSYGIDAIGKEQADNNNGSTITDEDANAIATQAPQNLVKYTITFQPTADTLRFRYVFASEEYPEFSCREYNDLFGFFISGPGINGNYQNKGINIARIPATNKPVTINNIHPEFDKNCNAQYSQFYHENNDKAPVYDGFLDVFTAEVPVIPCQTYTIKLVIADVGDKRLDSGVFLEAKSFGTNGLKPQVTNSVAVEGCSDGEVVFSINQPKSIDYQIPITVLGGSAVEGKDYKPIPSIVTIPKGKLSTRFRLEAIADNEKEDFEDIILVYDINECKKDTIWLNIKDNTLPNIELGKDISICAGEKIQFDATLPKDSTKIYEFLNEDAVDVNTIGVGSTNPPTQSIIAVNQVAPALLNINMLQAVCMDISHDRVEDLDIYLIAPNGKRIELSTDNGGNTKDYSNVCFKPSATQKITTATAPFQGDYQPEGDWAVLYSEGVNPINGNWALQVIDDQVGTKGKLNKWSMLFQVPYDIQYQWFPRNAVSCAVCPNITAAPQQTTKYKVIATDIYGCQRKDSVNVVVANRVKAPTVTCQMITANSITFAWQSVEGAATGYEISINGGAWFVPKNTYSHTVDNLKLGQKVNIQVRAKVNSTCNNASAEIGTAECSTPECFTPNLVFEKVTHESCFNKKDGSIVLKTNANSPTFYLNQLSNTNGVFTKLSAGLYTAKAVDIKGCTFSDTIRINTPPAFVLTGDTKPTSCKSIKSGQINLTVQGASPPYAYEWSNGQKTTSLVQISSGNYTVTITDSKQCVATKTFTVNDLGDVTVNAEVKDIACHGLPTGAIQINANGGLPPYRFLWSNQKNTPNIENLTKGAYNLTITDDNGCQYVQYYTVNEPLAPLQISIQQSDILCTYQLGYANAFVTGGVAPYQYAWSNKAEVSQLKQLPEGTYYLTVTDANGCIQKAAAYIQTIGEPTINATQTPVSCFDKSDASISIDKVELAFGDLLPTDLQFVWSNGAKTSSVTNLKGGQNYTVTITNNIGCTFVKNFNISQPSPIQLLVKDVKPTACYDSNDGSASVSVVGGTAPFSYFWDNATGKQTTATAVNLPKGTYYIQIKDAHGCQAETKATIESPTPLKISYTPTNVSCKDGESGKLETHIVGGIKPYRYKWNDGATDPMRINISAGQYALTISDANGCIATQSMKLLEPEAVVLKVETNDIRCNGGKDGKIKLIAQGGTPPYKYSIDGNLYNSVSNIVGLKSGYYDVSVKDIRGCIAQQNDVFLEEPNPIPLTLHIDTTITFGDTIILNGDKGLKTYAALTYLWQTENPRFMSCTTCPCPSVFPTRNSNFTLKVTDGQGCTAAAQATVRVEYTPNVKVPTGFSPNADGANDALRIHGDNNIRVKFFNVFARDGALIFSAHDFYVNDENVSWDGTVRGKALPSDSYIWDMEVEYPNGQTEILKGNTTLLR